MRWCKYMEKTNRSEEGVWGRVITILNRIGKEDLTNKVVREKEVWQRAFQAERKASTKALKQECAWYIQGTARRLWCS